VSGCGGTKRKATVWVVILKEPLFKVQRPHVSEEEEEEEEIMNWKRYGTN
jgi:hypothetical protein